MSIKVTRGAVVLAALVLFGGAALVGAIYYINTTNVADAPPPVAPESETAPATAASPATNRLTTGDKAIVQTQSIGCKPAERYERFLELIDKDMEAAKTFMFTYVGGDCRFFRAGDEVTVAEFSEFNVCVRKRGEGGCLWYNRGFLEPAPPAIGGEKEKEEGQPASLPASPSRFNDRQSKVIGEVGGANAAATVCRDLALNYTAANKAMQLVGVDPNAPDVVEGTRKAMPDIIKLLGSNPEVMCAFIYRQHGPAGTGLLVLLPK